MSVNFIDVQLINGILAHINVAQIQMVRELQTNEAAGAKACIGLAGDPDPLYVTETLQQIRTRINIWSE
jgi:hypothetical protein